MSKILVVDDESSIVELVEENLAMEGYETSHAYSGEEALELMRHAQPDLVLLDVMMPGMDGYEVSRQMQADPQLNHIPIIMLTARSAIPDKVMGYSRGVDDYVTKPFDSDELLVRVRAQLHHLYHEDVSDITGLPGSKAVEDALKQRTSDASKPWNIVYIDIERFTIYNENYSFLEGDELIKATASLLREAVRERSNPDDFLGHVGGDNFVFITTPDRVKGICELAAAKFNAIIPQYYTASDRNQGYVLAMSHDGQVEQSPLAELSFDVVDNQP